MTTIGLRPTHTIDGEPIETAETCWTHNSYRAPQRTSAQAMAVFAAGIVSVTVGWGLVAILTLMLAAEAQREIDESDGELGGEHLIALGKMCAWISLAVTALALVLVLPMIA